LRDFGGKLSKRKSLSMRDGELSNANKLSSITVSFERLAMKKEERSILKRLNGERKKC
jgi:hypothetical protein